MKLVFYSVEENKIIINDNFYKIKPKTLLKIINEVNKFFNKEPVIYLGKL